MKYFFFILILSQLACLASTAASSPAATPSPTMPAVTGPVSDVLDVSRAPVWMVVCAREFLNVRGGPSTDWPVLYQLEAGERVRVSDWSGGWGMINAAEWVNASYLCP